jgi:hypothetical protein
MKSMKAILGLVIAAVPIQSAFSYGVGYSSFPLTTNSKLVSTELSAIFRGESGVGMQVRYTQKVARSIVLDGGVGIAGGDRDARVFLGADYELFPDYMRQPRISVKASYERAMEYSIARDNLTLTPTVSKGFNFWGQEAYPYLGLNTILSLDGKTSTYKSQVGLALGINSNVPIKNLEELIVSFETHVELKDSYTGVFTGISYPF